MAASDRLHATHRFAPARRVDLSGRSLMTRAMLHSLSNVQRLIEPYIFNKHFTELDDATSSLASLHMAASTGPTYICVDWGSKYERKASLG